MSAGGPTLEWFGCSTFRVRAAGRTLFFDTYLDKVPGTPDVGLRSQDVDQADFVFVSHAHFDHLLGADTIACATGSTVVASHESCRVLRKNGVPDEQMLPVSGGETIDCGAGVRVRVFPSLHSCLFAASTPDSGAACLGDLGVPLQARRARVGELFEALPVLVPEAAEYLGAAEPRVSREDGGQLTYLLETPEGSMLVSASSGYWSGILGSLQPDVAVLALAGRPNVDGEPFQGSLADYLEGQVELLRPRRVVLCHHDVLLPGVLPAVDTAEAEARVARNGGGAAVVRLEYSTAVPILRAAAL